mmetsp:Transcript_29774/g.75787  ORF Transcript_29774/g.75787 Transcript_29774/m.75787 type:complete len:292 (-) Transcript_29774:171-1046(-)
MDLAAPLQRVAHRAARHVELRNARRQHRHRVDARHVGMRPLAVGVKDVLGARLLPDGAPEHHQEGEAEEEAYHHHANGLHTRHRTVRHGSQALPHGREHRRVLLAQLRGLEPLGRRDHAGEGRDEQQPLQPRRPALIRAWLSSRVPWSCHVAGVHVGPARSCHWRSAHVGLAQRGGPSTLLGPGRSRHPFGGDRGFAFDRHRRGACFGLAQRGCGTSTLFGCARSCDRRGVRFGSARHLRVLRSLGQPRARCRSPRRPRQLRRSLREDQPGALELRLTQRSVDAEEARGLG